MKEKNLPVKETCDEIYQIISRNKQEIALLLSEIMRRSHISSCSQNENLSSKNTNVSSCDERFDFLIDEILKEMKNY